MLIEAQSRTEVVNLNYVVMMQVIREGDLESVFAEDVRGRKFRLGEYGDIVRATDIMEDILNKDGDKFYRMPEE